jgi:hypothetical protein
MNFIERTSCNPMSYALLDNASLTAVQRLLGNIETRGKFSTDGDIVALEHVVEAILFYNEVACLNDYKPEYRESRQRDFPFIRFLEPSEFGLPTVREIAAKEAAKFKPIIRGGEFADADFKAFFDQVRMHIICTWDMAASVYYLTMKMLGQPNTEEFEKYTEISAAIFNELTDSQNTGAEWDKSVELFDSRGQRIDQGYVIPDARWAGGKTGGATMALQAFVAALNWLAQRTIYYSLAARHLHADTFLHPIRGDFQLHYMNKTGVFGYDFVHAVIDALNLRASSVVADLINRFTAHALRLELPMFSAWLVQQTGDVSAVIRAALELRGAREFSDARYQLLQIREAYDDDDLAAAGKKAAAMIKSVEKVFSELKRKYGANGGGKIPLTAVATVYNPVAKVTGWPALPPLKAGIPIPEFIQRAIPRKGMALIYRNIANELPRIWKLGEVRRQLTARVHESAKSPFSPKAEDPKYRHAHSHWKSPM